VLVETTPYVAAHAAPGYPAATLDPTGVNAVVAEPAIVSFGAGVPVVPATPPIEPALTAPEAAQSYAPESYAPESYAPESYAPAVAVPVSYAPPAYTEPAALPDPVAVPESAPVALETYAPPADPPHPVAPVSYDAVPLPAPTAPPVPETPAPEAAPSSVYPAVAYPAPLTRVEATPAVPTAVIHHESRRSASSVTIGHEPLVGRQSTEQGIREEDFSLAETLNIMLDRGASDLHLTSAARPTIRVSGSLTALEDFDVLTPPVLQRVIYSILTQAQRLKFEEHLELDFAYSLPGRARFRVNVYKQRDSIGAAFRIIPFEIRSLESLGIPPSVANFANLPRGFVLVTGPTGSGKSTTLASVVDLANRTRHDHIMTVEDPIEFLHRHKNCLVNQREVGEDTWSFSNALKHVLRQDPDIILVGEMRDLETISVALTAAETGHLVFATLHTQDAAQTIDRIIDVFPPHQQTQVRAQLAMALQGVVCQTLAKSADGHGRVVATEVLVVTPAVRNLIREGKTHQIYSVMQAGAAHGMHTLDQHLAELVRTRRITYEVGIEKCHHIEDFNRLCGRA
jgi:twitching motility protein PilT